MNSITVHGIKNKGTEKRYPYICYFISYGLNLLDLSKTLGTYTLSLKVDNVLSVVTENT